MMSLGSDWCGVKRRLRGGRRLELAPKSGCVPCVATELRPENEAWDEVIYDTATNVGTALRRWWN